MTHEMMPAHNGQDEDSSIDTISISDLSQADLLAGQEGLVLQRLLWWTVVPKDSPLADANTAPFFEIVKRLKTIRQPIGWSKQFNPMTEETKTVGHSSPLQWLKDNLKPNTWGSNKPNREALAVRYDGNKERIEAQYALEEAKHQEKLNSEHARIARVIERIMSHEHDPLLRKDITDKVTGMTTEVTESWKFPKQRALDFLKDASDRLVNNDRLSTDFVVAEKLLITDAINKVASIIPSKDVEAEESLEDAAWAYDHGHEEDDQLAA